MKKAIINLFDKRLEILLKPFIEEKLEIIEQKYTHNYFLLERTMCLFMIRMQKKHGRLIDNGWEMYLTQSNPFAEEVRKEMEKK